MFGELGSAMVLRNGSHDSNHLPTNYAIFIIEIDALKKKNSLYTELNFCIVSFLVKIDILIAKEHNNNPVWISLINPNFWHVSWVILLAEPCPVALLICCPGI